MSPRQSTNHIFLVRPVVFYSNPETSDTNLFQTKEEPSDTARLLAQAQAEMDGYIAALERHGVKVTCMDGSPECPDHIFPGNWASTHEDGLLVYYPMLAPNRRKERTPEMRAFLEKNYAKVKDYTAAEEDGRFLESTGSFVLDRVNKVAYVGLSPRSDESLAKKWAGDMGYELVSFRTRRPDGGPPVYHTDLMLFIGTTVAGLCTSVIIDEDRARVVKRLSATHEIVDLSLSQVDEMAGNGLEVVGADGAPYLLMSSRGHAALTDAQRKSFGRHVKGVIHAPLPTVEKYAGGSARCLVLELF